MKDSLMFSAEQMKTWQQAFDCFFPHNPASETTNIPGLLLTDEDVMQLLKISKKTLYNYRKKGIISYIPILGRYYYYLPYLIKDLLELNKKNGY
jgi:hypothetical protein